jgi:DnaJ-class molecular chaperone
MRERLQNNARYEMKTCWGCDGTGKRVVDGDDEVSVCDVCSGTGSIEEESEEVSDV